MVILSDRMSSKMKLSKNSSSELDYLSTVLGLRRNIICRMALGLSLNEKNPPAIIDDDSMGQEFNKPTILGTDEGMFSILTSQHYGKRISEEEMFSKYMRAEISFGIHLLYERYKALNSPIQFFEELCDCRGEIIIG